MINKNNITLPTNETRVLFDKWKRENIIKLASIYDNKGNFREIKLQKNEAESLGKSYLDEMIININKNKKKVKLLDKFNDKKVLKLEDIYNNINLESNIDKIVNKIEEIIGVKETIMNITFNLTNSVLKLKNDYLGSKIKVPIFINLLDKKVNIIEMNKSKYYEIYDNSNNKKLIYDYYTNLYKGYFEKKNFISISSNKYIENIPSMKELLETFGLYQQFYKFESINSMEDGIKEILYNLVENIKIIKQYLYKIRYKMIDNQTNNLVKTYVNKISKINLSKNRKNVFDKIDTFLKFEKIEYDLELNKYYSKYDLIKKIKVLNKLINYFNQEIIFILEINKEKYTKINFIRFLFSVIIDFNKSKIFNNFNFDLIRYKYILKSELLETIRDTYIYTDEELLENKITQEEIEKNENEEIDKQEEIEALDVDQEYFEDIDEEGEEQVEFMEGEGYIGRNAVNLDFKYNLD